MRTRLFSLILALFAVLLPSAAWADDQGYVELKVNNGAASIGADDATLSLTFLYGEKPTNVDGEIDDATVWYFDLNPENAEPGWIGDLHPEEGHFTWRLPSRYAYAPKITTATFTSDFTNNVHPTSCHSWFRLCKRLSSIEGLSTLDVSKVTTMAYMFACCESLQSIDMTGWATSSLESIPAMFYLCSSLAHLDVKHFDVSKVTDMNSTFTFCNKLKTLDLSTWETTSLKYLSDTFVTLTSIKSIDISNFDISNVTTIKWLFRGNPELTTIYVGNGWNTSRISSKSELVFEGDISLVGGAGTKWSSDHLAVDYACIDDPDSGHPGYLTGTKAFAVVYDDGAGNKTLYLCNRGASEVKTTSFKPAVAEGEAEVEYTSGLTVIDNLSTMGDNKWNLHALLTEAGVDVADIDHVVIEKTFAYMRPTTCESWFSGMSKATFDGLENLNTTECTSMKDMFRGTSISSLDFSTADLKLTFKTSKVTDMSGMFADMANLTSVTFASNFSTANVTNMENMFSGCSSLTDISTLAEYFNTVKVTDMSGMFQGCSSLTGNTTEDSGAPVLDLSTFYTGGVTDMADMFSGCSAVKLLNISSFNTSAVTSMAGMFKNCSQLKTITVDLSFTADAVTDNGTDMFLGDENLVGGDMTVYDAGEVDKDYAHIDEAGDPGYLTEIAPVECTLWGDTEHDNGGVLAGYAGKTGIVNVRRTFVAGQWTTLCLPFDMTAKQITTVFGEGTAIKALSAATRSGEKVSAATFADAATIEAGKPYLIMPAKVPTFSYKGQTVDGFRLSHKTFVGQPANMSRNGFAARGTFSPLTLAVSADTYTLKANQTTASPSLSTLATVAQETTLGGLQAYFVDMKVSDYTITVGSEGLATLYLDYAVEIPDVPYFVPCIVTDIYINPYDYQPGTATLKRIKEGVIPANTGVLINANPGTYTLCVTDRETDEDLSGNWLKGVTEETRTVDIEYNNKFVDANADGKDDNNNVPYYSIFTAKRGVDTNIGFFYKSAHNWNTGKNDTSSTVAANKAFIRVLDANLTPAAKERGIVIVFDETTGIENVEDAAPSKADGIYYNLNGQRVAAPTRGIYIKDGKKVLVK